MLFREAGVGSGRLGPGARTRSWVWSPAIPIAGGCRAKVWQSPSFERAVMGAGGGFRPASGGDGRDPVLVELQEVMGGGNQPPLRPDGSSASSSELPEAAVVLDLPEGRLHRLGA